MEKETEMEETVSEAQELAELEQDELRRGEMVWPDWDWKTRNEGRGK